MFLFLWKAARYFPPLHGRRWYPSKNPPCQTRVQVRFAAKSTHSRFPNRLPSTRLELNCHLAFTHTHPGYKVGHARAVPTWLDGTRARANRHAWGSDQRQQRPGRFILSIQLEHWHHWQVPAFQRRSRRLGRPSGRSTAREKTAGLRVRQRSLQVIETLVYQGHGDALAADLPVSHTRHLHAQTHWPSCGALAEWRRRRAGSVQQGDGRRQSVNITLIRVLKGNTDIRKPFFRNARQKPGK